jgi:hypothetical protein
MRASPFVPRSKLQFCSVEGNKNQKKLKSKIERYAGENDKRENKSQNKNKTPTREANATKMRNPCREGFCCETYNVHNPVHSRREIVQKNVSAISFFFPSVPCSTFHFSLWVHGDVMYARRCGVDVCTFKLKPLTEPLSTQLKPLTTVKRMRLFFFFLGINKMLKFESYVSTT